MVFVLVTANNIITYTRFVKYIVVILFYDNRPIYRKLLNDISDSLDTYSDYAIDYYKKAVAAPDDSISVSWVRWIPHKPIPSENIINKYGKDFKSDYSNDDFQPYISWETKGVTVYLSNDKTEVYRVDFNFTKEDYEKSYVTKYGSISDFQQILINSIFPESK